MQVVSVPQVQLSGRTFLENFAGGSSAAPDSSGRISTLTGGSASYVLSFSSGHSLWTRHRLGTPQGHGSLGGWLSAGDSWTLGNPSPRCAGVVGRNCAASRT